MNKTAKLAAAEYAAATPKEFSSSFTMYLYRAMENRRQLPDQATLLPSPVSVKTVSQALRVPFQPLALRRPLKLFKTALGLTPGIAAEPDPDFLVFLVEGSGHQAQLRAHLDTKDVKAFKNFEHLVRGEHTVSATTRTLLRSMLKVDEATLDQFVHGKKDGPLSPFYLELFEIFEGLYVQIYGKLASAVITCPCCKGNILDDMQAWWHKQSLYLESDAYQFVDRLLKAILGGAVLQQFLNSESGLGLDALEKLIDPKRHPMGQWMEFARIAKGLNHDWQLTASDSLASPGEGTVQDGRLRKWRSGQDLIPLEKAQKMLHGARNERELGQALLVARTFALAIDVVQSTTNGSTHPSRKQAQEVVARRFKQLCANLQLSLLAMQKRAIKKNGPTDGTTTSLAVDARQNTTCGRREKLC